MSLATWRRKYYPKPAEVTTKEEAIEHSIRKWEGLQLPALAAEHVDASPLNGVRTIGTEHPSVGVSGASCALCFHYRDWNQQSCRRCPLAISLGASCYADSGGAYGGPWRAWTTHDNPRPMLAALLALRPKPKPGRRLYPDANQEGAE